MHMWVISVEQYNNNYDNKIIIITIIELVLKVVLKTKQNDNSTTKHVKLFLFM